MVPHNSFQPVCFDFAEMKSLGSIGDDLSSNFIVVEISDTTTFFNAASLGV